MEFDENLNRLYGAAATIQTLKYRINVVDGDIPYLRGGRAQPFQSIAEAREAVSDAMQGLNAQFDVVEAGNGLVINNVVVWEG